MGLSVLIMKTPECCGNCPLTERDSHGPYCIPANEYFDGDDSTKERAVWCPLRKLPDPKPDLPEQAALAEMESDTNGNT